MQLADPSEAHNPLRSFPRPFQAITASGPSPSEVSRLRWPLRVLEGLLISGLLALPVVAQAKSPTHPASPPTPDTSVLDAALFYQLLLGELQLRENDPGSAYSLVLDAAHKTQHQELYRRAVDIALQARSGNAALNAASDWAEAYPNTEEPHRFKLQILLALNRPVETGPVLRKLIDITPSNKRIELISAIPQLLSRTDDKAAALKAARLALTPSLTDKNKTTAAAAWHGLGRMQFDQPDHKAALESCRRALQLDPAFLPSVGLALDLMEEGQADAEALVRQFLKQPSSPALQAPHDMVQLGLARVLTALQRHPAAQQEMNDLLTRRPELAEAWLLQGALHLQQRLFSEAQAALEKYLALTTSNDSDSVRRGRTQAWVQLSQMAEQQQDYPTAQHWLDQITDPPDLIAVQIRRAYLLAKQGRMDDARQLLRQTPQQNAADAQRKFMAEAHLLRDFEQHEAAWQVFQEARQQFPDDPDLIYEQAMVADKAGKPDDMERLLRQLIALKPDHHHAYNALGYALADRNERLPEAKELIQKALASAPNDPYILDSLGWVEFRLGRKPEALRILQDAYRRRPDAEIAAHLGEVHWSLGQQDTARKVWQEGLRINPQSETLLQTLKRLHIQP